MTIQRATLFTREHVARIVKNIAVHPIWEDESTFVYLSQSDKGSHYVRMDCLSGKKTTLENYQPESAPPLNHHNVCSADQRYCLQQVNHNLILFDAIKNQQVQLTHDGTEAHSYAKIPGTCRIPLQIELGKVPYAMPGIFSPDGKYFLTYRLDERKVKLFHIQNNAPEQRHAVHYQFHYAYVDEDLTHQEFIVVDLENAKIIQLNCPPLLVEYFTVFGLKNWVFWSEHSNKFYYLRYYRGYKKLSLCQYDLATHRETVLLSEEAPTYIEPNQVFFWDSNIYVLEESNEIIWWSQRDNWGHLYLYQKDTGQLIQQITQGSWAVLDLLYIDKRERIIYFIACGKEQGGPYYRYYYRINFDGSNMKCLTPQAAEHFISTSPQCNYFVDTYSTISTAPISECRDRFGHLICHLETADLSQLEALGWHKPEPFSILALDGKTVLYGALFKPSDFDEHHKYPIIDHIYPGPQNIHVPKAFSCDGNAVPYRWPGLWTMQALAECGFIVICLDAPGTTMRSKSFQDVSYGNMQAGGLEQHIATLQQLAQQHPFIDISRVGITGHSAGGYIAARAVLQYPDFFKVAVAGSGVHDLKNFMAYWSEKYQGLLSTGNYDRQANHDLVTQLRGHLLLIHGELDDNVHVHHSIQLYENLLKAGKMDLVELTLLANTHHECDEHPVYLHKMWHFFLKHL
jgi:dipeptidyl-peptidase-4